MKNNPFYALSAAAMLGGCWLLSHALALEAGRIGGLLVLVSALQVYEWLLVVLGAALVSRGLAPRDGTMALSLATVFLVDLTLVGTECATADARLGPLVAAAILVSALARLAVACRLAPGVASRQTAGLLGLHAALVLALPVAAVQIAAARRMGPAAVYGLSWAGLALPLLQSRLAAATRGSAASAPRLHALWSWLPAGSAVLHLAAVAWIHDAALTPACAAPLLLGIAIASPRERLARQLVLPVAGVGLSLGQPALGFGGAAGDPLVSPLRLALLVAAATWAWLAWRDRELWPVLLGAGAALAAAVGPTLASLPDRVWQLARLALRWAPREPVGWGAISVTAAFLLLALALWRSLNPPLAGGGPLVAVSRLGGRELGALSLLLCGLAHTTVASNLDPDRIAPPAPAIVALLALVAFGLAVFALRRATHGVLDPFARRLAGLAIAVSVVTLLAAPAAAFSDDSFHHRIEKPGRRACVEPKTAVPSRRTS
jgi:hypothetical protein